MEKHVAKKVLVINSWWAGVLASIFVGSVLASAAYALSANADLRVLQRDVKVITEADLPVQVAALKEQVQNLADSAARVERKQDKMDDKIDKLLSK